MMPFALSDQDLLRLLVILGIGVLMIGVTGFILYRLGLRERRARLEYQQNTEALRQLVQYPTNVARSEDGWIYVFHDLDGYCACVFENDAYWLFCYVEEGVDLIKALVDKGVRMNTTWVHAEDYVARTDSRRGRQYSGTLYSWETDTKI